MLLSQFIRVATPKPAVEVADIFRQYLDDYLKVGPLSPQEWQAVQAIMKYLTAAMGAISSRAMRAANRCNPTQHLKNPVFSGESFIKTIELS